MMPSGSICSACVSPYWSRLITAVVGVTPSGITSAPIRALMKADLPALNSPTITRRKSDVSCSTAWRRASWSSSVAGYSVRIASRRSRSAVSSARRSCCCSVSRPPPSPVSRLRLRPRKMLRTIACVAPCRMQPPKDRRVSSSSDGHDKRFPDANAAEYPDYGTAGRRYPFNRGHRQRQRGNDLQADPSARP